MVVTSNISQYALIYIKILFCTTTETNIHSALRFLQSWGYSQSAAKKMNGAPWLVALQMPANRIVISIVPNRLPKLPFILNIFDTEKKSVYMVSFPWIIWSYRKTRMRSASYFYSLKLQYLLENRWRWSRISFFKNISKSTWKWLCEENWQEPRTKAMFTLQVLMLTSDFLMKSNAFCVVHINTNQTRLHLNFWVNNLWSQVVVITQQQIVYRSNNGWSRLWIHFKVYWHWEPTVSSQDHNNVKDVNKKKEQIIVMAFYDALTATSVEKSVWRWSQSQEWSDCDELHFSNFFHRS